MIEGFLLDADYVTREDKAVIRLWCTNDEGDFSVLDENFEPYFYVIPKDNVDSLYELEKVIRIEEVSKKEFGKPIRTFKVFAEHPQDVPRLREEVRDLGMETREADVLFAVRYLIDRGLVPFDGIKIEGREVGDEIFAESVEHLRRSYPKLRVMAFDCEMAAGGGSMPSPERDPIVIISVATNEGVEEVFIKDDEDDDTIINRFLDFINEFDPHIIVGYNSDAFDWPYIIKRAKKHKITLSVGKDGSKPRYDDKGLPNVKLAGRIDVDLYKIVARDLDVVKVKTLKNVADYLGVMKREERVILSSAEISECWNDPGKRETLYKYAIQDAVSTLRIADKLLPLQYELTRMVRYPLEDTSKMGRGRMVESFLSVEAYKNDELVPQKRGECRSYAGGFVLEPKRGLHENVICLDFSSMYPSIMISYNISPDTITQGEGDFYEAPEVGHRFLKKPDGFFKRIISNLIDMRSSIKREMEDVDGYEKKILDMRQKSIKILTNAFYGYTGWNAARWYRRECAEATTAWGRYFIQNVIKKAEAMGFEVIYGDTDSIFVKSDINLIEKAEKLSAEVSEEMPLELEIEERYDTIFFTDKKKRYAGLTADGEILVRGLEVRRGDWCELAKEVQSNVIELILQKRDPDGALLFVKDMIKRIKKGEMPFDKFVIYKTLTKKIERYEVQQAHTIAASRAMAHNVKYDVGSKVPYVICKGSAKVSERAYPAEFIDKDDIDAEYYIHHQIIPVSLRILSYFGYTESSMLGVEQKTLSGWF